MKNLLIFFIKLIHNKLLIMAIKNFKYKSNFTMKLKIFFLDNMGYKFIDYNNIYLIIKTNKISNCYKLDYKLKKDNTISRRTANITNKYLLSNVYDIYPTYPYSPTSIIPSPLTRLT